ncbi:EndoU domain-containing protein [Neobacillus sp. LXY-4]|uniref:EndoU domain-containing protein n=1 Tax=Neobacillus sp. LXY-4 TaxID=3379826 RepID=UPI003EDF0FE1
MMRQITAHTKQIQVQRTNGFFSTAWNIASNADWKQVGIGALQAIGGGFTAIGGASFAVATSTTGVGAVAGGLVAVYGVNNATAGLLTIADAFTRGTTFQTKNIMREAVGTAGSTFGLRNQATQFYDNTEIVGGIAFGGYGLVKSAPTIISSTGNTIKNVKNVFKTSSKGTDNLIKIDANAVKHADVGDFTIYPKIGAVSRMKGGGHGQSNLDYLNSHGIEYNIVKTYDNGVRIGNVPLHKTPSKRTGTNQAWFPESWSSTDIQKAGESVANLPNNINLPNGTVMFGNYNGVRVGVIKTNGQVGTIFPDATRQP